MKLTLWIDEHAAGPFDLCEVARLYQHEIVTGDTPAMTDATNESVSEPWKPLKNLFPSLASIITTSAMTRKLIAGLQPDVTTRDVSVTDIDMPFVSMVYFMLKWAIAAIPAAIILTLIFFAVLLVVGLFGGFTGLSR